MVLGDGDDKYDNYRNGNLNTADVNLVKKNNVKVRY
jgi:hypothetical protein